MNARRDDILFHGTVEAAAFLIDRSLCGEIEARRRVFALWEPGVRVAEIGNAYLVRLARPMFIAASRAPGLPLIERKGALIAFDGASTDRGTLNWKHHGEIITSRGETIVDPARWIDLSNVAIAEPSSLGAPPPPPNQIAEPDKRDVREIIPGAPPLSPRAIAAAKAILGAGDMPFGSGAGGGWTGLTLSPGCVVMLFFAAFISVVIFLEEANAPEWIFGVLPLVVLAMILLGRRTVHSIFDGSPSSAASTASASSRPASPKPSRIRRWLSSIIETSRLSRLVGRMHAEYLVKMLSMFDDGNLDEALRHAIPLGGDGPSEGLAFRPPTPRSSLTLNPWGGGARTGMPLHESIWHELTRRYRDAFERLDRAGRVEDAAFVLAELLRSSAEAVAYLERKGRFKLAAEVAEARDLPANVVVRQWLLAGDQARAVAIARARGAFAVAVTSLEKTHPETAKLLRVHWAEWLAASGNYSMAVDVIWSVEESRGIALAWIDRAIDQGGGVGARMLARRLTLAPDDADETLQRIVSVLETEDSELAATRLALGRAIGDEPHSPHARIAARVAVRTLLRDGAGHLVLQLANRSGDQALRHDLPVLRERQDLPWTSHGIALDFPENDRGASVVHDVAVLHEGRVAVALGESGVSVIGRDGSRLAQYDQPSYRLVLSDAADRAIAIAPRGAVLRLARMDFAAKTAEFWCDARLTVWSRDYDGGLWFAAVGNEILAIDATAPRLDSLWHNPDFPAPVEMITRTPGSLRVVGDKEDWRYELPSLTLRSREKESGETRWNVVTEPDKMGTRILLYEAQRPDPRVTFTLTGSQYVQVRLQSSTLAIGDDCGRVIVFDLVKGIMRRDLRV